MRGRIAVIGGGAAGLSVAYLLRSRFDVTLYEREGRLGGHARTVVVDDGAGAELPVDIGFMVHNDRNYPTLRALFARLGGLALRDSEMSFGFCCRSTGLQYALNFAPAGGRRGAGPAPQPAQSAVLRGLLAEILRFCRTATRDLEGGELTGMTLAEYLEARRFSERLIELYVMPMGAAIWSTPTARVLEFPAETYLRFFANHGLLSIEGGPQWHAIEGGSRTYVDAIRRALGAAVVLEAPVERVIRHPSEVEILSRGASARFDHVVIATHADEALALLADPSDEERRLLGAFQYQQNEAVLHTDASVMPPDRSAWASWNYERERDNDRRALSVTYHLNRIQGVSGARDHFLSLNRRGAIDEARVIGRFSFTHPTYTFEAVRSQPALAALSGARHTSFCGSYFAYGFHEDAVRSGAAVARAFGVEL